MAGADEDDGILSPAKALPMFRDSSLDTAGSISRGAGVGRTSLGRSNSNSSSNNNTTSSTSTAVSSTSSDSGKLPGISRRAPRRAALRSRKGGAIELGAVNLQTTFVGPDGLDRGFPETGTFRWDSTVADAAASPQEDLSDQGGDVGAVQKQQKKQQLGGIQGIIARRKRRHLKLKSPPTTEMVDMEVMELKPWFVILPESKAHQIFDHLGEKGVRGQQHNIYPLRALISDYRWTFSWCFRSERCCFLFDCFSPLYIKY